MPTRFTLNGKGASHNGDPEMPLLWAIRDDFGLTGTKFGCGIAQCGACTVHIDGEATRSCVTPVASVAGKTVTTIEGLNNPAGRAVTRRMVSPAGRRRYARAAGEGMVHAMGHGPRTGNQGP